MAMNPGQAMKGDLEKKKLVDRNTKATRAALNVQ